MRKRKCKEWKWLFQGHTARECRGQAKPFSDSKAQVLFPLPHNACLENDWPRLLPFDKTMLKPAHTNWDFQGIKFHNPTQCLTDLMIRKLFTYVMNIPWNNMEIHFLLTEFFTQGCHLAAFQIIKTAPQMPFLQSRRSWTCWPLPVSVPTGSFAPPLHLHPPPPPPRMLSWASLLGSEKVTL